MKDTLKVVESDIRKLKKKIREFQRNGNFSQIGWRIKVLTKLQKKATLIYRVLESNNKLRKEWINLK